MISQLTLPTEKARLARRALLLVIQATFAGLGYAGAYALAYNFHPSSAVAAPAFALTLPYLLAVRVLTAHLFHLDRGYWQHFGSRDLLRLTAGVTAGSLLFAVALLAMGWLRAVGANVLVDEWMLAMALNGGARLLARLRHERAGWTGAHRARRAFIIGAGETGEQIARQLQHDPRHKIHVAGFIDDDPAKRGAILHGIRVLGPADGLRELAVKHHVDLALVAIPSATTEQLRRLVSQAVRAEVQVKALPLLKNLVTDDVRLQQFHDVQVEDLLGRDAVSLDLRSVRPDLAGKVVVVTGGAGSIGSELARQIARFHPLQLILVDRAESPLYFTHLELAKAHPEIQVVPVLASVTNAERMRRVFEHYRPDCVFHTAAYKHVPLLEASVIEGVWNNVLGTLRIARAAARAHTKKFVLISTDKAANPRSVLGVTKLIAERLVLELPSLVASSTDFRAVRFGNVLGSEGSVVPLFKRQLAEGGPITVTHPEVRRYFMTIPEAAQLVLQALALPEAAGRIAILEMGRQVRIVDLAEQLVRLAGFVPHQDIEIVFTGLRPGEKLEEELVAQGERARPTSVDKIRVVEHTAPPRRGLARRLRALAHAASNRDESGLLRALAALAPEYQVDGAAAPVAAAPVKRTAPAPTPAAPTVSAAS